MLISHPHKNLYCHLYNTYKIGNYIFKQKRLSFKAFSAEVIEEIVKISLLSHDLGKAMLYFQEYMYDIESNKPKIRHKDSDLKNHGLISGLLAFVVARKMIKDDMAAFLVYMAVSKHHGNYDNISDYLSRPSSKKEISILKEQFESIDLNELQKLTDDIGLEFKFSDYSFEKFLSDIDYLGDIEFLYSIEQKLVGLESYLLLNLVFSILIFSDKLEAIFHSEGMHIDEYLKSIGKKIKIDHNIVEDYKSSLNKNANTSRLREEVYQDVLESVKNIDLSKKILSINLPTGSGKTLTALKCGLVLRQRMEEEKGIHSKIIYILPFTSVIEQNYDVFADVIKSEDNNVLLKHHHMSERFFKSDDGTIYDGSIGEHLVETWESEIVVSTFVQFLHSILTNKNRQLKKFHNIANSIIILDEVQNVPYKYWGLIKEMLISLGEYLNCRFILMTATMPLIFDEEAGEIFELAKRKEKYFKMFNRVQIDASLLREPMNLNDFKYLLYKDINEYKDKSFLIVVNTIKSSIEIYRYLYEEFGEQNDVIYLSTNIIPKERIERINSIKESKSRKIIVSTQMVEAGVDIDIDRVYRDFGPMDSINQTAGRCNREGEDEKGFVTLVLLKDENNKDRDYYKYIYDDILMESTIKAIDGKNLIEEKDIHELSYLYFNNLKKYSSRNDSVLLLELISKMNYRDAFEDKEKNKHIFEIIPQSFKTVDVFIEIDDEASNVWRQMEEIKYIKDRFVRKRELNRIKKDVYQYVVSIPETIVKKHINPEEHGLSRISFEMLDNVYDENTGFIREEINDYIF